MKIQLILLTLFAAGNLLAQGLNVAVVDMEKVFSEYHKTIRSEISLQRQNKVYKEYAMGLERELEGLQNRAAQISRQAQDVTATDGIREQAKAEMQRIKLQFDSKREELRDYQNEKKQKVRDDFDSSRKTLIDEIIVIVQEEAKRRGLDMVLDSSGKTLNGIPAFVHFRISMDVTEAILARLNQGKEAEIAALLKEREALQKADER